MYDFNWPAIVYDIVWFILVLVPVWILVNYFKPRVRSTRNRKIFKTFVIVGSIIGGIFFWILVWLGIAYIDNHPVDFYEKDTTFQTDR